jgi:ABC-type glycerol-3-phosphate transport system substrate-binding protein
MCFIACWFLVCFLGCNGHVATQVPPESVTITFAFNQADETYYKGMVEMFNTQFPHITVELRPYQRDQQGDITGDSADVLQTWDGTLRNLFNEGELVHLDSFIETDTSLDLDDLYPGALALFSYGGRTWGIPAGMDVNVVYYSLELFNQYSVPYPENGWTRDDFLETALILRDPDAKIYGYVETDNTNSPRYSDVFYYIRQHGGQYVDNLAEPTRVTFDDPLLVEALAWYVKLHHEYAVAPTPRDVIIDLQGTWPGHLAIYDGIYHGKVGMWILPFSERGGSYWPSEWYIPWSMVTTPQDTRWETYPSGEGFAISKNAQDIDAGWQWMVFLSKAMPYRLVPARKSLLESIEYETMVGDGFAEVARLSMDKAVLTRAAPGAYDAFEAAFDIFNESLGQIINGELTVEEAMDWAQREAEMSIVARQ